MVLANIIPISGEIKSQPLNDNFSAINSELESFGSAALQDYEEGSWTPTLKFGGSDDGITYVVRQGRYVRIGNIVQVEMSIRISSKGTSTGTATIEGLPFPSSGVPDRKATAAGWHTDVTLTAGSTQISFVLEAGSAVYDLYQPGDSVGFRRLEDSNFGNSARFYFSGTYRI